MEICPKALRVVCSQVLWPAGVVSTARHHIEALLGFPAGLYFLVESVKGTGDDLWRTGQCSSGTAAHLARQIGTLMAPWFIVGCVG